MATGRNHAGAGLRWRGLSRWFEERGEIPLLPPSRVREYGPLTDDPDRPVDEHFADTIRGVAFAIEYCDSHGWMSTRTIRCLAIDPGHPACLSAYCNVRDRVMSFRVDRIISIIDLRIRPHRLERRASRAARALSGRTRGAGPYVAVRSPRLRTRRATASSPFSRSPCRTGRLGDEARDVVLDYVKAEAAAAGCAWPPFELVELWVDNLAPPLDGVFGRDVRTSSTTGTNSPAFSPGS